MPSVWGPLELELDERRCIAIGDSELWIERRENELQAATRPEIGAPVDNLLELPARCRVANRDGRLIIAPRLADRFVVGRLEEPVIVAPGASVQMYIGTAVWVVVASGSAELAELPLALPPDTWFGPNPRLGELCYASRTRGSLDRTTVGKRIDRAVIAVLVRNDHGEALRFERIRLPVPNLALYESDTGALWTSPVTVKVEDPVKPDLDISDDPPETGTALEKIAGPRQATRVNLFSRALGSLL